jgi:hypothetical protein
MDKVSRRSTWTESQREAERVTNRRRDSLYGYAVYNSKGIQVHVYGRRARAETFCNFYPEHTIRKVYRETITPG